MLTLHSRSILYGAGCDSHQKKQRERKHRFWKHYTELNEADVSPTESLLTYGPKLQYPRLYTPVDKQAR